MSRFRYSGIALLAASLSVMLAIGACSKMTLPRLGWGDGEPGVPSVPLRVRVELDPLLTEGALPYKDSCGDDRAIPIGEHLTEMLRTNTREVFQEVIDRDNPSTGIVADAVVHYSLEERVLELNIPRREAWQEYPAKAILRVRVVLREARDGEEIFARTVTGTGSWKVESDIDGTECALTGIGIPVRDALDELSGELVKTLRQSAEIQAAATRMLAARYAAGTVSQPGYPVPGAGAQPGYQMQPPAAPLDHRIPEGLSLRALLKDANGNRIFEGGESLTLRVEVANGGPGIAQDLMIALGGTPSLVRHFRQPVPVGNLRPGERKEVTLQATLPGDIPEQQSELVVQVSEAGGFALPPAKRFIAWVRPSDGQGGQVEVLSVDVDQVPTRIAGFERKNMHAVVVGIGTYRGDTAPSLAYAKRDAEIVAQYLQGVGGIPEGNIRVLTDDYAVLSDLRETFERWLPRKVTKNSIVVIYFVGNGLARTRTGDVFIVPYEGRTNSRYRIYPLAHLVKTLDQMPTRATLLFFDLSFDARDGASPRRLAWLNSRVGVNGRSVIIASSNVASPSVQFHGGQHGLFTYYVLKGLRGGADTDRSGSVSVTELYRYLRKQMPAAARAQDGEARTPVMVPRLPVGSRLGTFLIGKVPHSS